MNTDQNSKIIMICPLCDDRELQVSNTGLNLMQCISCGYSTSDNYIGDKKDNKSFNELDDEMKKWSKEKNGQIWIPAVVNLPVGLYYPVDVKDEMKWAMAPLVDIPEDEKDNYKKEDETYYEKKYDIDNQMIFDNFGKGITTINNTLDKMSDLVVENKEKSPTIKLPKLKK